MQVSRRPKVEHKIRTDERVSGEDYKLSFHVSRSRYSPSGQRDDVGRGDSVPALHLAFLPEVDSRISCMSPSRSDRRPSRICTMFISDVIPPHCRRERDLLIRDNWRRICRPLSCIAEDDRHCWAAGEGKKYKTINGVDRDA